MSAAAGLHFKRLLLTGAAGNLGRVLRPRLRSRCEWLRLSDQQACGEVQPGEEDRPTALQDFAAMRSLLQGVDAVVHMGGISVEAPWAPILAANIEGAYHLYEAARLNGVRRIVLASSNHVTGFYRQDEVVSPRDPVRPDGLYGLSKAFGENLAQMYWDRHGIESVCLRIGSSWPEPADRRMLATWLSHDDLERLVLAALRAPVVGCSVIYGMSDNAASFWDNTPARHIGYRPLDSSEPFRAAAEARQPVVDPHDPVCVFQGGGFVRLGPFE